jgi:hypothetical protein
LEEYASALPAKSSLGALFHCYLLLDLASRKRSDDVEWKTQRLVLSVRNFIKRSSGVEGDESLSRFYVNQKSDQFHTLIQAALDEV